MDTGHFSLKEFDRYDTVHRASNLVRPLEDCAVSPVQSQASVEASGETPARILVVEDERIVAHDLASALRELGYAVPATVATGEEAVERARELQPDVVLMDIRLPGAIDGIRAASSIRPPRQSQLFPCCVPSVASCKKNPLLIRVNRVK